MKLIAHRGLWKTRAEQNTLAAIEAAFWNGAGVETDLRSWHGHIYLSHDPISEAKDLVPFEALLILASEHPDLPLFLNIKEDGLLPLLQNFTEALKARNIIFFDMSVPELVKYAEVFPPSHLASRVSDLEPDPHGVEFCDWLWVDGFRRELTPNEIKKLVSKFSRRCAFVSPELHGREGLPFRSVLESLNWLESKETYLCTDWIGDAKW